MFLSESLYLTANDLMSIFRPITMAIIHPQKLYNVRQPKIMRQVRLRQAQNQSMFMMDGKLH